MRPFSHLSLIAALALFCSVVPARAQITIAPFYASDYSFVSLGSAPGVPANYGGLTLKAGDANTLLLGGAANGTNAGIYNVSLVRGGPGNRISGFTGTASLLSTARGPSGGIDGGLAYGPGNVLFYTSYSDNHIGQIKPGSTTADKLINLNTLGISASVGSLNFVPSGFATEGHIKIVSYNTNNFYDATLTADGTGTYNITNVTLKATLSGGVEGITYVPAGSPLFTNAAMLVSEYQAGRVSAYDVDANGDPIVATRRDFITGLTGAEGATIDPLTGDFLFSTFGGSNQVISVRGFTAVPEPGTLVLLSSSLLPLGSLLMRKRRRKV